MIAIDFESIRREARGSSILILETLSSLPIRFRVSREPSLDPSLYDTLSNLVFYILDSLRMSLDFFLQYHFLRSFSTFLLRENVAPSDS